MAKAMNKVLGMFWEPDKKTETPAAAKAATAPVQTVKEIVAPVAAGAPAPTAGQIDESIKADLLKTLETGNLEGYDYFEFRSAIKNMEKVIPSEPDRFKAAFAAVESFVTTAKLIETVQHYLGLLNKKSQEFETYAEKIRLERVVAREDQAKQTDGQMAQMRTQIDEINKQISTLQEGKVKLMNEAISERAKIDTVAMNFRTTYSVITQEIEADLKRIQMYLPVAAPK